MFGNIIDKIKKTLFGDIKLKDDYYDREKIKLKELFDEKEYDKYVDFAIDIGILTRELLDKVCNETERYIVSKYIGLSESEYINFKTISENINISFSQTLYMYRHAIKKLARHKTKYINLMNEIPGDIANYLVVGIVSMYNINFINFIFDITDHSIRKYYSKKIWRIIHPTKEQLKEIKTNQNNDTNFSLINFPEHLNPYAVEIFNGLEQKRHLKSQGNKGKLLLDIHNLELDYESKLEQKMLILYDKFRFVKDIKSQSIRIDYEYNGRKHKYYPDFQILTNTNKLVIVEIKNFRGMFDRKNLIKYGAMKAYCERNGFGYVMIDDNNNTLETLKSVYVSQDIADAFIERAKQGEITYPEIKGLISKYNINKKQLASIVLNNYNILEFNSASFSIKYIKK